MRIEKLQLVNFRLFSKAEFSFSPGINVIVGPSGSGKTTIIEAIGFAIYGEPLRGANLLEVLGPKSDSCNIMLSVYSERYQREIQISREISDVGKSIMQKILLNGEEMKVSDLSKIEKTFPDKKLFFEAISVDQLRLHNLLVMKSQEFQDIFSSTLFSWDLNRVLDNSKSLQFYLTSRENTLKDHLAEIDDLLVKQQNMIHILEDYVYKQKELTDKGEDIKNQVFSLEKDLTRRIDENKRIDRIAETLEKERRYIKQFLRQMERSGEALKDETSNFQFDESFVKCFNAYISYSSDIRQKSENVLESILPMLRVAEDSKHRIDELNKRLSVVLREKASIEMTLEEMSSKKDTYERQKKLLEEMSKKLKRSKSEVQEVQETKEIQQKLDDLIHSIWDESFSEFLLRLTSRANGYLREIAPRIRLAADDQELKILFNERPTSFTVLSGGERTLLNLLIKTALVKEIGTSNLMLLDDPIAFLDQEATGKVSYFLNSLKKQFDQIIIATQREDLSVEFENRIALNR